ncbi:MAG: Xaa-Pro peptidase family protein [Anaerolineae bacterium]
MLTREGCLQRQARFKQRLAELKIEATVISDARDIYYFTGMLLTPYLFSIPCCLWLDTQGNDWLIAPMVDQQVYIAQFVPYDTHVVGTVTPLQVETLCAQVEKCLPMRHIAHLGYQQETLPQALMQVVTTRTHPDRCTAIDGVLASLQACKDEDEIELLRRAIQINLAAYTAVQAAIVPGVTELEVLAAGQRGALLEAGEWVYHNGDYRCGTVNGTARARPIEEGSLYIVDAWTCYRGYWADLSRTFVVGQKISSLQQELFDHMAWVQEQGAAYLKAGTDGREIWAMLDRLTRQHPLLADSGLTHHGGHGIGLRVHEMPDINRTRGGRLEVGNVICIEPGGYTADARLGVRIENMYLITAGGANNLSPYPVRLAS